MRPILIVIFLATCAQAKDMDWTGVWTKEGGGSVNVGGFPDHLEVNAPLPSAEDASVRFTGSGTSTTLTLQGKLTETVGFTGALDREKGSRVHDCTLTAKERRDGDDEVAFVTYSLDGSQVRTETWRRPIPPIEIHLKDEDRFLYWAIDGKRSKTGLQIVYTVNGNDALTLQLEIRVDDGHPCPEFYENPVLYSTSLGTVQPGEHTTTWDVRDRTPAARIALAGPYKVKISASPKLTAEASFRVAQPHCVFAGTPSGNGIPGGTAGVTAPLVSVGWNKGWDASGDARTTTDSISQSLSSAAFAVLTAHGTPTSLTIEDANGGQSSNFDGSALGDLKDLHLAVVVACWTGVDLGEGSPPNFLQNLTSKGCDVALGFSTKVLASEALDWIQQFMKLLERGSPIKKTARDTARNTLKQYWQVNPNAKNVELDVQVNDARRAVHGGTSTNPQPCAVALTLEYGKGIDASEQYWPPRYGNSKN